MIDLAAQASLAGALGAAAARWPDAECLIEADRDRETARLTYREFQNAGLTLGGLLQALGFAPGDRAVILLPNQAKWPISAYAVFVTGGVLVPLDPKLSPADLGGLLRHATPRLLIADYHIWRSLLPETMTAIGAILVVDAPSDADLRGARRWDERSPSAAVPHARQRGDAACIVYSSGTGGRTKGCVLTHDNYLQQASALAAVHRLRPGDRYLSVLPTHHAIDFMAGFIGPFTCGATVVHVRTLRPEYVRLAFARYGITDVTVVPMILENLETAIRNEIDALPPIRKAVFLRAIALNRWMTRRRQRLRVSRWLLRPIHHRFGGRLRAVFVGGAFSPPDRIRFFLDLGIPVANGYGLTEACTVVTVNDVSRPRADTVGRPLPGIDVRAVDPDEDGVGRIAVRGPTVMASYLDDAELTRETIVDGWLLTGDVGRMDDTGHLSLIGRVHNMIVTPGGKNVYPEDVESSFAGLSVREFCLVAAGYVWPEPGSPDERLIAVIRTDAAGGPGAEVVEEIRRRNRRLPAFKRIDGYVVWPEEFPRTTSLKVRRDLLAARLRAVVDRRSGIVTL